MESGLPWTEDELGLLVELGVVRICKNWSWADLAKAMNAKAADRGLEARKFTATIVRLQYSKVGTPQKHIWIPAKDELLDKFMQIRASSRWTLDKVTEEMNLSKKEQGSSDPAFTKTDVELRLRSKEFSSAYGVYRRGESGKYFLSLAERELIVKIGDKRVTSGWKWKEVARKWTQMIRLRGNPIKDISATQARNTYRGQRKAHNRAKEVGRGIYDEEAPDEGRSTIDRIRKASDGEISEEDGLKGNIYREGVHDKFDTEDHLEVASSFSGMSIQEFPEVKSPSHKDDAVKILPSIENDDEVPLIDNWGDETSDGELADAEDSDTDDADRYRREFPKKDSTPPPSNEPFPSYESDNFADNSANRSVPTPQVLYLDTDDEATRWHRRPSSLEPDDLEDAFPNGAPTPIMAPLSDPEN